MPSFLEFEGKNVDKALQKASEELKTTIEKLKHDVVSYGSSGIFGLVGAKKAKIRVYLKEEGLKAQKTNRIAKEAETLDTASEEKEEKPAGEQASDTMKMEAVAEIDDGRVEKGLEVIRKLVGYILRF